MHQAGRRHSTLWMGFLLRLGRVGWKLYQLISLPQKRHHDGWKSTVSKELFASLARRHGLLVVSQENSWGDRGQFKISGMYVTEMSKPAPS